METPEQQPEPEDGDRIEEGEVGAADGLNDAEGAGPEGDLPSGE